MNYVITGATKGIGKALAIKFLKGGANIAVCARSQSDLTALVSELKQINPLSEVHAMVCDMGNETAVKAFANYVLSNFKQIDGLVNNAGLFKVFPLLEEPDGFLAQCMAVNVYGPYHLCRALVPNMMAHKQGRIFNICSVASFYAFDGCTAYNTSKHALLGLTRSLRGELKQNGIHVTAVMPGATFTASWSGSDIDPNRIMSPEDVAEVVWACANMSERSTIEEITMRPLLGDL